MRLKSKQVEASKEEISWLDQPLVENTHRPSSSFFIDIEVSNWRGGESEFDAGPYVKFLHSFQETRSLFSKVLSAVHICNGISSTNIDDRTMSA